MKRRRWDSGIKTMIVVQGLKGRPVAAAKILYYEVVCETNRVKGTQETSLVGVLLSFFASLGWLLMSLDNRGA